MPEHKDIFVVLLGMYNFGVTYVNLTSFVFYKFHEKKKIVLTPEMEAFLIKQLLRQTLFLSTLSFFFAAAM